MIGKGLRRISVQATVRYQYKLGCDSAHRDPHIIAGFRDPAHLEPPVRPDGSRDFRKLDSLLSQPVTALGDLNYRKPVWHLPLRAAPQDPILTDAQWADIAREVMHRTGYAPYGDDGAVRWIAVRHADDHIHIVATLARVDGGRPDMHGDGYRIREACMAVEQRYGLRRTAPADLTAARRPKRGETEKARKLGRPEASRTSLRRAVQTAAAGARAEAEFFTRLHADSVLIRRRFSRRDPGEVTGYAVAVPGDLNPEGAPIWYGGKDLAADLTLPKLRHRWSHPTDPRPGGLFQSYRTVSGEHLSARTATALLRIAVRRAADHSATPDNFLQALDRAGVVVRLRHSEINPNQITGYAVSLPSHHHPNGQPRWYGGSHLSDDLSWTRLQQRWTTPTRAPAPDYEPDLTHEERQAIYDDAARAAANATAHLRRYLVTAPHLARDACWAASDTLHVAAKATGNLHLRRAADAYDRAARPPHGRIPPPTRAGNGLRTAARILALTGTASDKSTRDIMLLLANLLTLIDTITQLHQTQQRQAQRDAARAAATHLGRATSHPTGAEHGSQATRRPSAVDVAMTDFPAPWTLTDPTYTPGPSRSPLQAPARAHQRGARHPTR